MPEQAPRRQFPGRGQVDPRIPLTGRAPQRSAGPLAPVVLDPPEQFGVLTHLVQHDRRDAGPLLEQDALARDDVFRAPPFGKKRHHLGIDILLSGQAGGRHPMVPIHDVVLVAEAVQQHGRQYLSVI